MMPSIVLATLTIIPKDHVLARVKAMNLLQCKYFHSWLAIPIMFRSTGFPKLFNGVNVSFHKRRNTTFDHQGKTTMQQV